MKKTLSVFLAILMIFSCFGVFSAGAANDEYTDEELIEVKDAMNFFKINNLPERFDGSIQELRDADANKSAEEKINLLGIDLDFLYSNSGTLLWSFLDVYQKDANGKILLDQAGNPIMKITKGEVAIMLSSVSAYLKDLFYSKFGGLKLYSVENAISLANIIGNIFFRDFKKLSVGNFTGLFGNQVPNAQEFFEAVVELSGLHTIIQENWCTRDRSFCEPIVELFGGSYIDIHVDNYKSGKELGARILEALFAKMNIEGPVATLINILTLYTRSYDLVYREPTLALFTHKIEKILNFEFISEYQTFSGLVKLIFCNCDPIAQEGCFSKDNKNVAHFCPAEFPTDRIAAAADNDEFLLYLFYYFNLCGVHRNNKVYINNLQSKISASPILNEVEKGRVNSILDGFFRNNIESTCKTLIEPFIAESFQPSAGGLFDRLKNSLQVFLKKIADYFEYLRKIFTGELEYGQGGSPFI